MTTTEPLHLEIIGLAESDEHNVLTFPASSLRRLEQRCVDLLKSKRYPEYVAEFIRAVAAFRSGGQPKAATQLMELGNRVVERLVGEIGIDGDPPVTERPGEGIERRVVGLDQREVALDDHSVLVAQPDQRPIVRQH